MKLLALLLMAQVGSSTSSTITGTSTTAAPPPVEEPRIDRFAASSSSFEASITSNGTGRKSVICAPYRLVPSISRSGPAAFTKLARVLALPASAAVSNYRFGWTRARRCIQHERS